MGKKTSKELIERLQLECTRFADETESSQAVADRKLAQSLIEYGERSGTAEALVLAARILASNPAVAADTSSKRDEAKQIQQLLHQAAEMRPGDKVLDALIKRFGKTADSHARALAVTGNAKLWVERIDRGKYYRLSPNPIFEPHVAARVVATAAEDPMLGITVRRIDLVREKRWVSRSRVSAVWNYGIYKKAWDIRVYNLSGPNNLKVRIETS